MNEASVSNGPSIEDEYDSEADEMAVGNSPEDLIVAPEKETLEILFQDEHLVIVNKPAGLLVHRSMIDRHERRFAMQLLRDQIGQHVFPVHRLDKPTAGILIFALNADVARLMGGLIEAHQIEKRYLAIVRGYGPEELELDYPLQEKLDKIADKKARTGKPPQQAVSFMKKLHQVELSIPVGKYPSARYSLMLLKPLTGRKHQLRRHMTHLRHPILGDVNYGDNKHNRFVRESCNFNGLALWSHQIRFNHPVTATEIKLVANVDLRFTELWRKWGCLDNEINNFWRNWWPI